MKITFLKISKDHLNNQTEVPIEIEVIRIQATNKVIQGKQGQPQRASWIIYALPGQAILNSYRVKYGNLDWEILSVYDALDENNQPHHTKVVI